MAAVAVPAWTLECIVPEGLLADSLCSRNRAPVGWTPGVRPRQPHGAPQWECEVLPASSA